MGVGMQSFIAVGVESRTSSTKAYSAAIVDFIPFTSETLDDTMDPIVDPSILSSYDEDRMFNGLRRVGGNISGVVHPNTIGYLARATFDAYSLQDVGAPFGQGTANSHAAVKAHRFTTGNTQFHSGSGSDLPTMTFEVYRGPVMVSAASQGSSAVYYNVAGNTLELSLESGNVMRFSWDGIGREFGGKPNVAPVQRPSEAFVWWQASLSVGGSGTDVYESLRVRINNNLEGVPKLDGRLRPDLVKRNDFRRVEVSGSIAFQNFQDKDRFQSGSESQIMLTARQDSPTISGSGHNNILRIDVPRVHYTAVPINAGGAGRIAIAMAGRGMTDPGSLYSCELTIVNTRATAWDLNASA